MRKMRLHVELTHASGSEVVGFLCSISYLSKKKRRIIVDTSDKVTLAFANRGDLNKTI